MLILAMITILLAIPLFYYFRASRRKKIKNRLSQCSNDIIEAQQELNDLLNSDRYVEPEQLFRGQRNGLFWFQY
jgi:hypothetical protein